MPPKKNKQGPSKTDQKKKSKQLEDKTFGLKNKNKSKKVQQHIQQMHSQVDNKKAEALAKKKAAEKAAAEKAKKEALLSTPIIQQKVPFGVDPKSVLCAFFKEGKCTKGDRCKFSHDLNVGRKSAKKDLYTDARAEKEEDNMEDWDEEKLRKVVKSKQGNTKTTTDIVCKYFLEAVENCKYGWFWVCPNGGNECKYRHSLPEGFVMKTKEQRRLEQLAADSAPKITLEDFIELEKSKLGKNLTPISAASFDKWKKSHQLKKLNEQRRVAANGKKILSGREVIEQRFKDKLLAGKTGVNNNDDEDDGEHGTAWDLDEFRKSLKEAEDENIRDYGDGKVHYFENHSEEDGTKEEVKVKVMSDGGASEEIQANVKVETNLVPEEAVK